MPKKYIVAIRFPGSQGNHLLEFFLKAEREAFIAEMKVIEPEAEAITTEIPE